MELRCRRSRPSLLERCRRLPGEGEATMEGATTGTGGGATQNFSETQVRSTAWRVLEEWSMKF